MMHMCITHASRIPFGVLGGIFFRMSLHLGMYPRTRGLRRTFCCSLAGNPRLSEPIWSSTAKKNLRTLTRKPLFPASKSRNPHQDTHLQRLGLYRSHWRRNPGFVGCAGLATWDSTGPTSPLQWFAFICWYFCFTAITAVFFEIYERRKYDRNLRRVVIGGTGPNRG